MKKKTKLMSEALVNEIWLGYQLYSLLIIQFGYNTFNTKGTPNFNFKNFYYYWIKKDVK